MSSHGDSVGLGEPDFAGAPTVTPTLRRLLSSCESLADRKNDDGDQQTERHHNQPKAERQLPQNQHGGDRQAHQLHQKTQVPHATTSHWFNVDDSQRKAYPTRWFPCATMFPLLALSSKRSLMIYVIATVDLVPGQREAFLAEFHKLVPDVLAEQGCLFYGPTVDLPTGNPKQVPLRENVVTIMESWESLEALQAHLQAPHMGPYRERVKNLVQSTQLQILQPV